MMCKPCGALADDTETRMLTAVQAHRTRIAHQNKIEAFHGQIRIQKELRLGSAACRALTTVKGIRAKGCWNSDERRMDSKPSLASSCMTMKYRPLLQTIRCRATSI